MRTAAVIGFYLAIYVWGWRQLSGKRSSLERLLLGALLAWALYINLSGLAAVPHFSVSFLYMTVFQPIGRAMIEWLGG